MFDKYAQYEPHGYSFFFFIVNKKEFLKTFLLSAYFFGFPNNFESIRNYYS